MDEQRIRAIIQEEIRTHASAARFGLNSIPRHIHNHVDSPYTFQPILTYAGHIASDGTSVFLPSGWSSSIDGTTTGLYHITHNLNTTSYTVNASAYQSTNRFVSPVFQVIDLNHLDVSWGGGALGDPQFSRENTAFYFALTVFANKNQNLPNYDV